MSNTNNEQTAGEQKPLSVLQLFTSAGVFAPKDVQPDTVELPDGTKAQIYVRALPDTEFRSLWGSGDRAKLIAATICDENGKPVMSAKQAGELKVSMAAKLQEIALTHCGIGKKAEAEQEEAGNE